jgi:Ca2+:H+ antiporter
LVIGHWSSLNVKSLLKPSLNWLLIFLPVCVVLELTHGNPALIFGASCLAIIPLAGWMGKATEHLAEKMGEGVGGLLNATFGNAAELIIALMLLFKAYQNPQQVEAMHEIVKASLTGSIIGNILLVLGLSLLAGGLKFKEQRFNPTAARSGATMLSLAAISLVIPAVFRFLVGRDGEASVRDISLEISVLLLVTYGLSLVFSLKTHKHLYLGDAGAEAAHVEEEHGEHWSLKKSISVLLIAAALVGVVSEFLAGSVQEAGHALHLTELFIGVIVVAIVGNAAEHSTAILMAMQNRMDLALSIAIGSSMQIALFVAPVLVLASYALGQPMNLVFQNAEVMAIVLSVALVGQISGDGESNWLEGAQLLMVYVMVGVLFFYLR